MFGEATTGRASRKIAGRTYADVFDIKMWMGVYDVSNSLVICNMNTLQSRAVKVYFHSSEKMPEIASGRAQLIIASPPYTNSPDGKSLDKTEYLSFLARVFCESYRVLKPGGMFVCINTDLRDNARYNGGDRTFNGLIWRKHSDILKIAESISFRCVDTKIWAKSLNQDIYRYTFAYIQFFEKPRTIGVKLRQKRISAAFAPDVWLLEGGTRRFDSNGAIFRDACHPDLVKWSRG
jgi:DNA modification methylase